MSRRWYILQTYTGYENKTERSIKTLLESGTLDSNVVTDVRVPVEEVVEIKDGKKKSRTNKFLPGYVMLEMICQNLDGNQLVHNCADCKVLMVLLVQILMFVLFQFQMTKQ